MGGIVMIIEKSAGMIRLAELAELGVKSEEDFRVRMMAQGIQYALQSGRLPGSIDIDICWHMSAQEIDVLVHDVCQHCYNLSEVPRYIVKRALSA